MTDYGKHKKERYMEMIKISVTLSLVDTQTGQLYAVDIDPIDVKKLSHEQSESIGQQIARELRMGAAAVTVNGGGSHPPVHHTTSFDVMADLIQGIERDKQRRRSRGHGSAVVSGNSGQP